MIPYYSFSHIHSPQIQEQLQDAASQVIASGNYVFNTKQFENEFAKWTGAHHCVAVNNGTSALHLALMALDIQPGDEVITVSHTFRATASAILYCGAVPKFVDIDPHTLVMDVRQIANAVTPRTKAIIAVHLYGNAVDMAPLLDLAKSCNLSVIEDCSQAHGTRYQGRHVGTWGDIGTFSFYPGKSLGALGDAGAVITQHADLAQRMASMRSWDPDGVGYNLRMSNLQAEFLRIKLRDFDRVLTEKRQIARAYQQAFGTVPVHADTEHSWHVYPLLVKDREKFITALADRIELKSHYSVPVHLYPAFAGDWDLPVTEWAANHQVSLPIYPGVDHLAVIDSILPHRADIIEWPDS